jgi:hypothetical protein
MTEEHAHQGGPEAPTPLARLRGQVLERWRRFPPQRQAELDALLDTSLARACATEPEVITVMNPVSRPLRLRLATLVEGSDLDSFYHREWAELAVSAEGRCYLVYRRRDGGDYAIEWSAATSLPADLMTRLPEVLALALLEGDRDAAG